jgi:hypothetical protein
VCCRDRSASATYFFEDQVAAKVENRSWLYLRKVKQEESESVRKEQVYFSERRGMAAFEHKENGGLC